MIYLFFCVSGIYVCVFLSLAYMDVCTAQRRMLGVFLYHLYIIPFREGLSLNLELSSQKTPAILLSQLSIVVERYG